MRHSVPKAVLAIAMSAVLVVAGCSASWITTALNDLPVLVQIAENIISIVGLAQGKTQIDAATAQQIQNVASQVKSDLTLVQSLVQSYQSADAAAKPGLLNQITTALTTVSQNLQGILAAVHVSNAQLQATITGAVTIALATVAAIQTLVPSTKMAGVSPVKPPTPAQIKSVFNSLVETNGYAAYAIH